MNFFSILSSFILDSIGFAGGGGSGSGGGGGGHSSSHHGGSSSGNSTVDAIFTVIFFIVMIICIVASKKQTAKREKLLAEQRAKYTAEDRRILEKARHIFIEYQKDWSNFDAEKMRAYMTDGYYRHALLMLSAIGSMHRQNIVSDLSVKEVDFVDPGHPGKKTRTIKFIFSGRDALYDLRKQKYHINTFVSCATETWQFEVVDGELLLDKIIQPTISTNHLIGELYQFAEGHNLCYSPDWGRYAMPEGGMLFDGVRFNVADINNHILGKWNDVLVQLYTYSKIPGTPKSYQLVGQLTVPKTYSGIIVRNRKQGKKLKIPKGYERYELEWEEFNRHFELYATDPDKITSFELLNPKFMTHLYDHGIECSLEVIEDRIYIFTNAGIKSENYSHMLDILTEAYQELKM